MAQRVKVFAVKPEYLSSVSRIYMGDRTAPLVL